MSKKSSSNELVSNRKARFNYEILDTFEAGIVLSGTEIKSLREGGGSLQEAYVKIIKNEIFLIGSSVSPYRFGNVHNHKEQRDRKLLMHGYEIEKLKAATQEKGLTIVPLAMYLKKGRVKVKIATAKGKQNIDKRETIKARDEKRHMDRLKKEHG
ncbi:MAG: SsrA-binding protein SmpB [Chlamydiota bacterium]|nr:SsrA-binding protein SmpB [Chlamydiota bacterium]